MVDEFTQGILALMIVVIMLGMGASLTPREFQNALKTPQGLAIGVVSQFVFMPLIGFLLVRYLDLPPAIAVGVLIMACMPGGTTSNIFTYFARGNLALSVLMTVMSTILGVVVIPLVLLIYASALELEIPRENIVITLALILIPVGLGMLLRRFSQRAAEICERIASYLAMFFIVFIIATWIPNNWQFLQGTTPATYTAAICLGLIGIIIGYFFARLLGQDNRNSRTIALETGLQNGPLAIAIVAITFTGDEAQSYMAVPALYSVFIVLIATLATLFFRAEARWEGEIVDG